MATSVSMAAAEYVVHRVVEQRLIDTIAVPAPAAGAEWSLVVPGGQTWELLGIQHLFTTSAVVANRSPMIAILDQDGNFVTRLPGAAVVAASSGARVFWGMGLGAVGNIGTQAGLLPTPPLVLQQGWTLKSLTGLIDAGDTYTQIVLTVRDWSPAKIAQVIDKLDRDLYGLADLLDTDG